MTAVALLLSLAFAAPPIIDVVYPRISPGDSIPRIDKVDSNFVFGSVQPPDAELRINGVRSKVWPDGAFLALLPADWTGKRFVLTAKVGSDSVKVVLPFTTKPVPSAAQPPAGKYPRMIELASTPARTDPKGTYFLFPAAGTKVIATEWEAGYYRVPLSPGRSAWIEEKSAHDVGKVVTPPPSVIHKVVVDTLGGEVIVQIPLDRKILVGVRDENDPNRLILELFGAVSRIDRIGYPPLTKIVREIYWEQPFDNVVSLDVRLNGPLWGYYGTWEDKSYTLHLRPTPNLSNRLEGVSIALDAGHGGEQDGAIGPTRHKEKDVNLTCALVLAKRLEKEGARVILTRTGDPTLGLNERVATAEAIGADLLISMHHNALPDGVDPFGAGPFGTGTHYYRPQSRDLAEAVQGAIVEELKLPDEGIYYDDLALVRPSFMPAILIEAAYMMMPDQESFVSSPDYPDRLAGAVMTGIERFCAERKK